MILAAGRGTRLRPITQRTPKALVEVAGVALLERVARQLVSAGVTRLIVNAHHHADQIIRFVEEKEGFGAEVRVSLERERLLDTGGGLWAAASLFRADAPFFLHNVDVVTELDLSGMYRAHLAGDALATLAVQERHTSRPLLVDEEGVYGLANRKTGWRREARPFRGRTREVGFAGVHVLSPEIFSLLTERGRFPIWDPYFRLVGEGRRIACYDVAGALWLEVGDPTRLARARQIMEEG
ncbi:MAG: sugar phosphate nucleotidyltransferase [Gemmatimonadota bacterium]